MGLVFLSLIKCYIWFTLDFCLEMSAPEAVTFSATVLQKNSEGTVVSSLVSNAIRKFDKMHAWTDVFGSSSAMEQIEILEHVNENVKKKTKVSWNFGVT